VTPRQDPTDDWGSFLAENPKVLWGLVADVVKAVKAGEGERKTGRRPAVSCSSMDELYDVLFPASFSAQPFPQALSALLSAKGQSQRGFASISGYSQASVNRMVSGKFPASADLLEHLSQILDVRPTYFVEYRALKIGQLVTEVLLADPHLSADAVRRLMGATS
jgi:hypothetical protein